jgi:hypothetical protein
LNVRGVHEVKTQIHTAEPNPFEAEIAIAKLLSYTDQILAELIQARGET